MSNKEFIEILKLLKSKVWNILNSDMGDIEETIDDIRFYISTTIDELESEKEN
jgi:hypothetical protein